jgi:hypothetical protein
VGISGLAGLAASLVVGGAVGATALVGYVSAETGPPSKSPVNVEQPVIEYGSTS